MEMKQLSTLCEMHNFSLTLTYGDGDSVWSIDIYDGKLRVYSSFVYKGGLEGLIEDATEAVLKFLERNQI